MRTRKIYKLINTKNNKIYIGKTIKDLEKRLVEHKREANRWKNCKAIQKDFGYNSRLYPAMIKHGPDAFRIELVEELTDLTLNLEEREKYWIAFFDSTNPVIGYNISIGGLGGPLFKGHKHSEASKILMRAHSQKGIKQTKAFAAKRHLPLLSKIQCLDTGEIFESRKQLFNKPDRKPPKAIKFNNYRIFKYKAKHYLLLGPKRRQLPELTKLECTNLLQDIKVHNLDFNAYANKYRKTEMLKIIQDL